MRVTETEQEATRFSALHRVQHGNIHPRALAMADPPCGVIRDFFYLPIHGHPDELP